MIDTNHLVVDFGKHRGELWTRVPADYLRWLANEPEQDNDNVLLAKSELERRGTVVSSEVQVTPHAVDRASIRLRKIWHVTAIGDQEGIYSWLSRMAEEALKTSDKNTIIYRGIKFVFRRGELYPVLKSVMKAKDNNYEERE